MWFRILGPLEVGVDARGSPVGPPRQQAVLATLLAHANVAVQIDALIEQAWDGRAPASARTAVHVYVFRLRQLIASHLGEEAAHGVLATHQTGYLLRVERDELDAALFRRLAAEGRRALQADRPERARRLLGRALGLWRGPVLEGLAVESLRATLAHPLEELRLDAWQARIDAQLRLGEHDAVIPELRGLIEEHPFRERFRAQLMTALYNAGRQAEALTLFEQTRRQLRDELGADPGVELRALHQAVLRGDLLGRPSAVAVGGGGGLGAGAGRAGVRRAAAGRAGAGTAVAGAGPGGAGAGGSGAGGAGVGAAGADAGPVGAGAGVAGPAGAGEGAAGRLVPAELPQEARGIAGRRAELERLHRIAADSASGIVVLHGSAGVGKTALAVRFAHQVARRYPDGQLFADLRAYDRQPPATVGEVLGRFLRALGTDPERIPAGVDGQAALLRSQLAGRRVLVVLDNVADASQVRPLLPGRSSSLVLVTSRNTLPGLVAIDGAHDLALDVLTPGEASELLAGVLGAQRVAADLAGFDELARLCAYLPLALRIAAARLLTRPGEAQLAGLLADLTAGNRLTELSLTDETAVPAAFDISCRDLDPPARRLFGRLGLVPGQDVGLPAAAALAGCADGPAARLLAALAAAHLVEQHEPGRYRQHDLLRLYADIRVAGQEPAAERDAALARLFAWYQDRMDAAARVLYPQLLRLPDARRGGAGSAGGSAGGSVGGLAGEFADGEAALAWLEAERVNLVAAVRYAARHGPAPAAWLLADGLRGFFNLRVYAADWLATAQAGLRAARSGRDRMAAAAMQHSLGLVRSRMGDSRQAVRHFGKALHGYRTLGHTPGQSAVLAALGGAYYQLGRLQQARDAFTEALGLAREHELAAQQAACLGDLGEVYRDLGELDAAREHQERALRLFRELRLRRGEALALLYLGLALHDLGRHAPALERIRAALACCRDAGSRDGEAYALATLAALSPADGAPDHDRAREHAAAALALAVEVGDDSLVAEAHLAAAGVFHQRGQLTDAARHWRAALRHATSCGYLRGRARAHLGLAGTEACLGRPRAAVGHARRALAIGAQSGYRLVQGQALTTLAAADQLAGRDESAVAHARQALELHRAAGHRAGEAHTLRVLGSALHALGDTAGADRSWRQARALSVELGVPGPEVRPAEAGERARPAG